MKKEIIAIAAVAAFCVGCYFLAVAGRPPKGVRVRLIGPGLASYLLRAKSAAALDSLVWYAGHEDAATCDGLCGPGDPGIAAGGNIEVEGTAYVSISIMGGNQ